jgi:hypothetical protein
MTNNTRIHEENKKVPLEHLTPISLLWRSMIFLSFLILLLYIGLHWPS